MAKCTYVKKSGNVCGKRASGVRCGAHKGKRNKLRRKKGRKTRRLSHTASKIQFYDVSTGKIFSIPRDECRIRRSNGRGGDMVYTVIDGRRFSTFVERGFEL